MILTLINVRNKLQHGVNILTVKRNVNYNQPIRMIYCIIARGLYSNAIIDRVQNLEFKEKVRIHLQKMCKLQMFYK